VEVFEIGAHGLDYPLNVVTPKKLTNPVLDVISPLRVNNAVRASATDKFAFMDVAFENGLDAINNLRKRYASTL